MRRSLPKWAHVGMMTSHVALCMTLCKLNVSSSTTRSHDMYIYAKPYTLTTLVGTLSKGWGIEFDAISCGG